jgi:flagellar motor switch/type III secretory pathway protein FliN
MGVREYKLINASERALLTLRVREVVEAFVARVAMEPPPVMCALYTLVELEATPLRPYEWNVARRAGENVLAVGVPADSAREFARLMLGDVQAVALDAEGLDALRELSAGLIQELGTALVTVMGAPAVEGAQGLHWGEGIVSEGASNGAAANAVRVECSLGERLRVAIMVWPELVLECLARAEPVRRGSGALESLRAAIQSGRVPLEVLAGEAEMAVGELATLRVGDVIKLDQLLDKPLSVRIGADRVIGSVLLGAHGGRAAARWVSGH